MKEEDAGLGTHVAFIVFGEVELDGVFAVGHGEGVTSHAVAFGVIDGGIFSVGDIDVGTINGFAAVKAGVHGPEVAAGVFIGGGIGDARANADRRAAIGFRGHGVTGGSAAAGLTAGRSIRATMATTPTQRDQTFDECRMDMFPRFLFEF